MFKTYFFLLLKQIKILFKRKHAGTVFQLFVSMTSALKIYLFLPKKSDFTCLPMTTTKVIALPLMNLKFYIFFLNFFIYSSVFCFFSSSLAYLCIFMNFQYICKHCIVCFFNWIYTFQRCFYHPIY